MAKPTAQPQTTQYFQSFPKVKFDIDKTYNYKDLEEWATVSSTGSSDESTHNKLILVKRDR